MNYYFAKIVELGFDQAVEATKEALKGHGFGILTEIDVRETLHNKLGVDFRPYRILGACNPEMAYKALAAEDKIGTMLPCNVIVRQGQDGKVEIAAVDPVASMQAIDNAKLASIAGQVRDRLKQAVDTIPTG